MYKEIRNYLQSVETTFWKHWKSNLKPSIFQHDYLLFSTLSSQIARGFLQVRRKIKKKRLSIVDIGCGQKPYLPIFVAYAKNYIGVDIDPQVADVVAYGEKLPFENNSFDLAVSFQTLEHSVDPEKMVEEMHRVLTPGGFVLASTHGAWIYHPNPHDYYRWTEEGLAKLFAVFSKVSIKPNLGTAASIIQLVNLGLYGLACRHIIWKLPLYTAITALNIFGRLGVDRPVKISHFTLNYLVVARK